MRLTLRTLLAYLDGILEPGDAEELGKKIEESEYAVSLVHRIRDAMRRLRLGAPSLGDRGPGLDPNTVAEYLDNTLASERVTDFEKVCLDSDIHLAEVSASHQILTLVLGETAEVDTAARQRMYGLKDQAARGVPPPTPGTHSTLAMPGMDAPPSLDLGPESTDTVEAKERKPRPRPTVPEYLREPRKRTPWWSIAAAVLLAVCIAGVVFKVVGWLEPGTPPGDFLARMGVISAPPEPADRGPEAEGGEQAEDVATAVPETVAADASPAEKVEPEPASPPPAAPSERAEPDQPAETPPIADEPPPAAAEIPPVTPAPEEAESKTPSESSSETPPEAPTAPAEPLPPEPLGRLMSSEQVLLSNGSEGGWIRVAANQMLIPQEVLAPPTYRPKIALTMGVTLEILGGSRVELLGSSVKELPGVRVFYGRVVLMPLGKAGSRMRLAFGNRSGTISFADAEAKVALDVRRIRPPGSNPETGPASIVAELFATTGGIEWTEEIDGKPGEPLLVGAGRAVNFDAHLTSAPMDVKQMPAWIEATPPKALDRWASPAIAEALPTDRLARLVLMELAVSRPQKEVKWLALRCLGYLGQFDDVVVALNDSDSKLVWSDYVEELCAAVGRDAETAAAVRATLEKQYPQKAAELYRMLWGYGNTGLQAGDDAALVRGLDDDLLAVRVLSYWNLRDITGQGAAYQPEQPAARRQQSVRRWRQRLDAKEIRFPEEEQPSGGAPP
ncbi:MAG: hypothetical protein JW959_11850 [Pirellulales bacterium]|nr:hypothetical protein [Pirellulales bacterium]